MKIFKLLSILVLSVTAYCVFASSQQFNEWVLLGEKKADFVAERDIIPVNPNPTYNKIKVKVLNGEVLMEDMKVFFGDGEIMDVSLKYVFDKGGYSRDIELPRGNRHITRISFLYRTSLKSFRRGIVQVWGRK